MSDEVEIKTDNEFQVKSGKNSANHTSHARGRERYVSYPWMGNPVFRERQPLYRFIAHLLTQAETLPDEEGQEGITFEQVLEAVQNS